MYFEHDTVNNCYYLGAEPFTSHTYQDWIDSEPRILAVDTETISLTERIAIGLSIASSPTCAFYFTLFPNESLSIPWHMLRDPDNVNVYHGGIFDLSCMTEFNVNRDIHDTNIMARLLCHYSNTLADLGLEYDIEVPRTGNLLAQYKTKTMLSIPEDVVAKHCALHGIATYKLFQIFYPKINHAYYDHERATIPVMQDMSQRGILIDQDERSNIEAQLTDDVSCYRGICDEMSFNPASSQQVGNILAERGAYGGFSKLPFTRNKYGRSGNLSTAVEVLEKMDDPLADIILLYRQKSKLLSTYITPWADEERARCRYHLDAITGRPSSTDRNMQNIPGKYAKTGGLNTYNCRGILLPDNVVWTDIDFSQLELRILANISNDREMRYIYETGGDIHQVTADFLCIDRKVAKNTNFAMVYGGTDQTIAETAHIKSILKAGELRKSWFRLFPQAGEWIQSMQESCTSGRARSMFGRDIRLPSVSEESHSAIERKAINYPIQSSAADILKRALVLCKDMDIALQVHDELLIDSFHTKDEFESLRNIAPFETPYEIKYCLRWE